MVLYFTGTGNSLYVAKQLDDVRISIPKAIHDEKKGIHGGQDRNCMSGIWA